MYSIDPNWESTVDDHTIGNPQIRIKRHHTKSTFHAPTIVKIKIEVINGFCTIVLTITANHLTQKSSTPCNGLQNFVVFRCTYVKQVTILPIPFYSIKLDLVVRLDATHAVHGSIHSVQLVPYYE